MSDPFREAIHSAGLEPPGIIEPGRFHRFPGAGKNGRNRAGWCRLFPDGLRDGTAVEAGSISRS